MMASYGRFGQVLEGYSAEHGSYSLSAVGCCEGNDLGRIRRIIFRLTVNPTLNRLRLRRRFFHVMNASCVMESDLRSFGTSH
jgi:hypothetical protein